MIKFDGTLVTFLNFRPGLIFCQTSILKCFLTHPFVPGHKADCLWIKWQPFGSVRKQKSHSGKIVPWWVSEKMWKLFLPKSPLAIAQVRRKEEKLHEEKCLDYLVIFKLDCICLLTSKSSLCNLDTSLLSNAWIAKVLSHCGVCLLTFWMVSTEAQTFFYFEVQLIFLLSCAFVPYLKSPWLTKVMNIYSYIFFWEVYRFSCYI